MYDILLASADSGRFDQFLSGFEGAGKGAVTYANSSKEALRLCAERRFDLLVADESLPDDTGLGLIQNVVTVNPLINCTLVSTLDHKTFHEVTEGLGVLSALPADPGADQAAELLAILNRISGLQQGKDGAS